VTRKFDFGLLMVSKQTRVDEEGAEEAYLHHVDAGSALENLGSCVSF
jgi:hypothetical protein